MYFCPVGFPVEASTLTGAGWELNVGWRLQGSLHAGRMCEDARLENTVFQELIFPGRVNSPVL